MLLKWSLVVLVIVLQVLVSVLFSGRKVHRTQSLNLLKLAKTVGTAVKDKIITTTPPPEEDESFFKSLLTSVKKIPKKMFKKAKETMAQEAIKHTLKGVIGKGDDSDENEVQKKGKGSLVKKLGKMGKMAKFLL